MKPSLLFAFLLGTSLAVVVGRSQNRQNAVPRFPFLDPELSLDQRVQDLLSRMTIEEKAAQWFNNAPAISRLNVPAYNWWSECLHGVGRAGYATVFPQAIGLAASWDTDLIQRVGAATADEARAKHHDFVRKGEREIYQGLTFWSPNINLFRDPRWGRGMETYGEDPYLTGKMGVAFIKGLQGDHPRYLKLVGTMKHFAVHSGPEPDRHTFNAVTNERDLRESYLPHFQMCVEEANVQSVMCAYNRYAGDACCGSNRLLTTILRQEWGFNGYVTSDCGAVGDMYSGHKVVKTPAEAAALAIKAGTDLNCSLDDAKPFEAVAQGLLSERELDIAIGRLLQARFQLGMFDPPSQVPHTKIPMSVVGSKRHQALALEAARKSIVLLKNENSLLPLRKDIRRIAVIGPNADEVLSLLGNYYGLPRDPVTPLRGIRKKVSRKSNVEYAPGCSFAEGVPLLETIPTEVVWTSMEKSKRHGLSAEYYNGKEPGDRPVCRRVDSGVDFNWCDSLPHKALNQSHFTVRWSGVLVPPTTGRYQLGTFGFRRFGIVLDDSLAVSSESASETPIYGPVDLIAGKSYRFRLEGVARTSGSIVQLLWSVPGRHPEEEALQIARKADVTVLVLGLSPRVEGEEMMVEVAGFKGGDRTEISLPATQERLMRAVSALGKPVVLVLLNGSALAIEWAQQHIPAVVECWYPGQAGGTALADMLFGDDNPGGRLPVTFYSAVEDLPAFDDYNMKGRTYRFFNGTPLYPFGFGLSYSSFEYGALDVSLPSKEKQKNGKKEPVVLPWSPASGTAADSCLRIALPLTNVGARAGDEVAQLYVRGLNPKVERAFKDLRGFHRVALKPGQKKVLTFELRPRSLARYISEENRFVVDPGEYEILVGASSADIRQSLRVVVQ